MKCCSITVTAKMFWGKEIARLNWLIAVVFCVLSLGNTCSWRVVHTKGWWSDFSSEQFVFAVAFKNRLPSGRFDSFFCRFHSDFPSLICQRWLNKRAHAVLPPNNTKKCLAIFRNKRILLFKDIAKVLEVFVGFWFVTSVTISGGSVRLSY